MNYHLNSRLINRIILFILPVVILTAGNFFYASYGATSSQETANNPFDETIKILERWTSTHWGQDCFVWVVHYPEEIADTWAESEALRAGMSYSDQEDFKQKFIEDLRLNNSETFLISVYSFGTRPANLSPVSEKVSLLSASGQRIKPLKYDSSLDYPNSGIVQGLVFFPKQINKDYVISIKGMNRNEQLFSFKTHQAPAPVPIKKEENKPEVVVVNLPKKQPKKKAEAPKAPPIPPQIPPRPITPIFQEDSRDMEDFVNSVRANKNPSVALQEEISSKTREPQKNQTSKVSNEGSAYSSRESVLRKFLAYWANNAPNEMYEMLSEMSQKMISRQNFAKEISKSSDMRAGLKGDYKIDWIGEERAKIITTHKALVFKSVSTRTLGITREGSSWKIIW